VGTSCEVRPYGKDEQERCITIKSTGISLFYQMDDAALVRMPKNVPREGRAPHKPATPRPHTRYCHRNRCSQQVPSFLSSRTRTTGTTEVIQACVYGGDTDAPVQIVPFCLSSTHRYQGALFQPAWCLGTHVPSHQRESVC
jgi:hypothetical protein